MTFRVYTLYHMTYFEITFDKGYKPETLFIFNLICTGIFLALFYIYKIVPYAPAFLNSFLLLVTVVKGKDPKRHL